MNDLDCRHRRGILAVAIPSAVGLPATVGERRCAVIDLIRRTCLGVSSRPEEGQSTVEYGVIISLISMAVTGVLVFLGSVVSGFSTR